MNAAKFTLVGLAIALATASSVVAQTLTLEAPGASDDLTERLRANSLVLREPEDGPRTNQDLVAAAQADYARLVSTLYEQGFFAPVVRIAVDGQEAASLSPFAVPSRIDRIAITVTPGPSFVFGTAAIGPVARGTDLPSGFQEGAPASTPILRAATSSAIEGWRERGHATAEVASQSIVARHRDAELDAEIRVEPGPVVTFGQLVPRGQRLMRPERIVEIAGLPSGVTFSPEVLGRATQRLRDTGVFSAVALQEQPLGPGNTMDIVAAVTEAPLRRIGGGAEISSDEGARVTAYWLHRNLFGGAERIRVDGEVSGIGQEGIDTEEIEGIDASLRARLSRPATFTPDTLAYGELAVVALDEPSFRLGYVTLEFGVEHWFSPSLEGALGIAVLAARFEDDIGIRNTTLFLLPGELTWDNRNDELNPTAGVYVAAEATPFASTGGSGGGRVALDARGYLGFGETRGTVLAARAQLGVLAGGEFSEIPPDFFFYSGGSGTVRGQEYQSLGAEQEGIASGGRSFAGLAAEFRQQIGDTNFGVAAFADAGFVAADATFEDGDWHAGAGLGLRYSTPFGPLRVDVATPVRGNGVGEDIFLYIGIGQSF